MNNVISLNAKTTPAVHSQAAQVTKPLLDLSEVSPAALHTIAHAMLRNHGYCPAPVLAALEFRAEHHDNVAATYEASIAHPDRNLKLNEYVERAFKAPKKAADFIRSVVYPEDLPAHSWFVQGEFKSPQAQKLWPEIYQHITELANDRKQQAEADYHRRVAESIRETITHYKAGRLIIETRDGTQVIMCSRKTEEERDQYTALQQCGLI